MTYSFPDIINIDMNTGEYRHITVETALPESLKSLEARGAISALQASIRKKLVNFLITGAVSGMTLGYEGHKFVLRIQCDTKQALDWDTFLQKALDEATQSINEIPRLTIVL